MKLGTRRVPNFGAPFHELPPGLLSSAGPFSHGKDIAEKDPPDQDQIPAGWGASPTGFEPVLAA